MFQASIKFKVFSERLGASVREEFTCTYYSSFFHSCSMMMMMIDTRR